MMSQIHDPVSQKIWYIPALDIQDATKIKALLNSVVGTQCFSKPVYSLQGKFKPRSYQILLIAWAFGSELTHFQSV